MIFTVQVLVQERVQEIVSYTASGHVMEILNYPAQELVQDIHMIFSVPVLIQEIMSYTASGHVMEILKCRCQACVGNSICLLHVLVNTDVGHITFLSVLVKHLCLTLHFNYYC